MKTKEFRYRIIMECNNLNERWYYVQVYRDTDSWFFQKREWQYEVNSRQVCDGQFTIRTPIQFESLEKAEEHCNRLVKKLSVVQEGVIERDIL
jgi:hypothetical protein